ncbi:hypothetical protein HID58_081620 [Brassica napus]|uniref:Uncharacterized protein n=1 Tax=Brassica napus TaxID=3708 RepID=A0ABQ7Y8D0_BRANA|nr:hypothetical protein HID58_081620 [Brassica napus]
MVSDAGSSVACQSHRLFPLLCSFVFLSFCLTVFLQKFLVLLGFMSSSAVALSVRCCSCRLRILWVLLLICSPPPSLMTALTSDLAQIRSSHKLHWPDLKILRRAPPSSFSWAMTFFPLGMIYSNWIWFLRLRTPLPFQSGEEPPARRYTYQSLLTANIVHICPSWYLLSHVQLVCLGSMTTLWIRRSNVGVRSFCLNPTPGYSANLAKFIFQEFVIRANIYSLLDLTHWCLPVTAVCA